MAKTKSPGKVLQSWVSPEFLEQVRERAQLERRPVSELVRIAVEDRLSEDFASVAAAEAERPGTEGSFTRSLSGAGQGEDG